MPAVSVLMPVYNGGRFLKPAIESILAQTFADFELIIVDDASKDASAAVVEEFSDSRIRYIKNEQNSGIVKSLNKGIAIASGNYIARMDADDIATPDRFSKQLSLLEARPEIGICGANCLLINEHNEIVGKNICPATTEELEVELMFRTPFAHPAVVMRRTVLAECGGYKEGMEPAEDYDLWITASRHCRAMNIQEYLLRYRIHGANYSKVKRAHYTALLAKLLLENADYMQINKEHINIHINFIGSNWDAPVTKDGVRQLGDWKKDLISRNESKGKYAGNALRNIVNKYYANALLSIVKSPNNGIDVKCQAAKYLLSTSPRHTVRHIMRKLS